MEQIFLIDSRVIIWVQEHLRSPGLTCVMRFITHLGDCGAVWILLAAALLIFVKTRRSGICLSVSLAAVLILNNLVLKNVFDRARPFDAISAVLPLIERPHDPSFPSGHASCGRGCSCSAFRIKSAFALIGAFCGFGGRCGVFKIVSWSSLSERYFVWRAFGRGRGRSVFRFGYEYV